MKNTKKILFVVLTFVLALTMVLPAFSATTVTPYEAKAGEDVTVTFKFDNIYGLNGSFDFDDVAVEPTIKIVDASGNWSVEEYKNNLVLANASKLTTTISVVVTIPDDAAVGTEYTLKFTYDVVNENKVETEGEKTVTIRVIEDEQTTEPDETTTEESTTEEPTTEEPTTEEPTTEEPTTEEPTTEEPTTEEPTTEESTTEESTTEESTPEESTPEESTPEESTPIVTDPEESDSSETTTEGGESNGAPVWPIVLILGIVAAAGAAGVLVVIMIRKKKSSDDTPLVDYSIEDDTLDDIADAEETKAVAEETVEAEEVEGTETAEEVETVEEPKAEEVEAVEEAAEAEENTEKTTDEE